MLSRTARRVLGGTAAAFDRAAGKVAARRTAAVTQSRLPHAERMARLATSTQTYGDISESEFWGEPRLIAPVARDAGRTRFGRQKLDLVWRSTWQPLAGAIAERYLGFSENRTVSVRLIGADRPRPVAIALHGYLTGHFAFEERVWPLADLDALGFDVALFTLPFHGLRAAASEPAPPFPSADPLMNHEGFRQAVGDLRDLLAWLLAQGHSSAGVLGMSLGAYTGALAATVDPRLAFCVPIVPLASIADFARQHGRLSRGAKQAAIEHAALDRALALVSPLHRVPVIAPHRMLVVGARSDRITPVEHAQRLAHHFGARLLSWPGGHLLQFGRGAALTEVGEFVRACV
jgi:pimeloyl-ACP methyl ester carboxylesterase